MRLLLCENFGPLDAGQDGIQSPKLSNFAGVSVMYIIFVQKRFMMWATPPLQIYTIYEHFRLESELSLPNISH